MAARVARPAAPPTGVSRATPRANNAPAKKSDAKLPAEPKPKAAAKAGAGAAVAAKRGPATTRPVAKSRSKLVPPAHRTTNGSTAASPAPSQPSSLAPSRAETPHASDAEDADADVRVTPTPSPAAAAGLRRLSQISDDEASDTTGPDTPVQTAVIQVTMARHAPGANPRQQAPQQIMRRRQSVLSDDDDSDIGMVATKATSNVPNVIAKNSAQKKGELMVEMAGGADLNSQQRRSTASVPAGIASQSPTPKGTSDRSAAVAAPTPATAAVEATPTAAETSADVKPEGRQGVVASLAAGFHSLFGGESSEHSSAEPHTVDAKKWANGSTESVALIRESQGAPSLEAITMPGSAPANRVSVSRIAATPSFGTQRRPTVSNGHLGSRTSIATATEVPTSPVEKQGSANPSHFSDSETTEPAQREETQVEESKQPKHEPLGQQDPPPEPEPDRIIELPRWEDCDRSLVMREKLDEVEAQQTFLHDVLYQLLERERRGRVKEKRERAEIELKLTRALQREKLALAAKEEAERKEQWALARLRSHEVKWEAERKALVEENENLRTPPASVAKQNRAAAKYVRSRVAEIASSILGNSTGSDGAEKSVSTEGGAAKAPPKPDREAHKPIQPIILRGGATAPADQIQAQLQLQEIDAVSYAIQAPVTTQLGELTGTVVPSGALSGSLSSSTADTVSPCEAGDAKVVTAERAEPCQVVLPAPKSGAGKMPGPSPPDSIRSLPPPSHRVFNGAAAFGDIGSTLASSHTLQASPPMLKSPLTMAAEHLQQRQQQQQQQSVNRSTVRSLFSPRPAQELMPQDSLSPRSRAAGVHTPDRPQTHPSHAPCSFSSGVPWSSNPQSSNHVIRSLPGASGIASAGSGGMEPAGFEAPQFGCRLATDSESVSSDPCVGTCTTLPMPRRTNSPGRVVPQAANTQVMTVSFGNRTQGMEPVIPQSWPLVSPPVSRLDFSDAAIAAHDVQFAVAQGHDFRHLHAGHLVSHPAGFNATVVGGHPCGQRSTSPHMRPHFR